MLDDVRAMSYADAQKLAVALPGRQNYLKSHFVSQVSNDIVDIALDYFDRVTSPLSSILFQYLGNAAQRVPATETAFGHRDALCEWATNAVFLDPGGVRSAHSLVPETWPRSISALLTWGVPSTSGNGRGIGRGAIQAAFGDELPEAWRR